MNLLITNTSYPQAYSIVLSLKPYCDRIVATLDGDTWLRARTAHAANSRLVDSRYRVPAFQADWLAGNIQLRNTPAEEAYIRRIEQICCKERIDTIFPSYDPEVYVFSKNKKRFADHGILAVAPDYSRLLTPLDKFKTVQAARRAGFPCPETYLPREETDLDDIARKFGPPWVIKPRFTAASRGTRIVSDHAALKAEFRATARRHDRPMVQEFIPGKGRQNYYLVADRRSDIRSLLCPRVIRISKRLFRNSSAAAIVQGRTPYFDRLQKLVHEIGWWGGLSLQTKVDARDGVPKLMEINPRLGTHLWFRTEAGIDEPLLVLKLARGEQIPTAGPLPTGAILLEPIEDLISVGFELYDWLLYSLRARIRGAAPVDPANLPLTPGAMFREYKSNYFSSRRRIYSPYIGRLFSDPLACILRYYAFAGHLFFSLRQRGR